MALKYVTEFTTQGWPYPHCFPLVLAIFMVNIVIKSLLETNSSIWWCMMMVALHTEIWWYALQTGCIYIHQHPGNAHLSLDDLQDMVCCKGEVFSNQVLCYAASLDLCGTEYILLVQSTMPAWYTHAFGLPTIFSTHSTCSRPTVAWVSQTDKYSQKTQAQGQTAPRLS